MSQRSHQFGHDELGFGVELGATKQNRRGVSIYILFNFNGEKLFILFINLCENVHYDVIYEGSNAQAKYFREAREIWTIQISPESTDESIKSNKDDTKHYHLQQ